jgi:hypothetical protein
VPRCRAVHNPYWWPTSSPGAEAWINGRGSRVVGADSAVARRRSSAAIRAGMPRGILRRLGANSVLSIRGLSPPPRRAISQDVERSGGAREDVCPGRGEVFGRRGRSGSRRDRVEMRAPSGRTRGEWRRYHVQSALTGSGRGPPGVGDAVPVWPLMRSPITPPGCPDAWSQVGPWAVDRLSEQLRDERSSGRGEGTVPARRSGVGRIAHRRIR